ncbi:MAG: DUF4118 domain-containing protein [Chitinophagaceae bacterium]|nr:DUF4118 domain-containing protein [Chitinophagaceae bacterium]
MLRPVSKTAQLLYSTILITLISLICWFLSPVAGYRVVAFILLVTVSLVSLGVDILPGLWAAFLTALIWDFFFIPPRFTLQVGATEDLILLLMYFVVATTSAIFTYRIRKMEKKSRERQEKEHTLKLYNTLFNSLSHELRTPIAAIIAATDNLQQSRNLTPENKYELISEIAKASFRLNRQVDNLLSMSRLEAGFIHPAADWCDITELLYHTVQQLEELQGPQRISINVNPSIPLCRIDRGLLEQVLTNLLINAITHGHSPASVDITAACHADLLEIVIDDNGPGFDPKDIAKAFDPFFRAQHSKTGGTGLGLSIVKGFVESMHGRVHLENRQGGGSSFTIAIPVETSYLKNLKNE